MNTPKLRFKDDNGNDFPEWEIKKIRDVTKITTGGTPNTSQKEYWGGEILWMNSGELNLKKVYEVKGRITEKGLKKSNTKIIPKFCVLVGLAGQGKTRGTIAMNMIELCTNQSIASIHPNKNFIPEFLYQNLNNRYLELRKSSMGEGGRGSLNIKIIENINVNFPCLEEQTKIGNFFATIDKKISQLQEKKRLLALYKKGIMQQIFSQELRFKDENGNYFPEWEEKTLGEVCTSKSSNISANTLENNEGIYKVYGASGFLKKIDFYKQENEYISIVKDGAGVGRVLLCEEKSSVLGTLNIIEAKSDAYLRFIYVILQRIDFEKYIVGSVIPHIYFKDYSKIKIPFPCLQEQTLIGNFLSAIDKKIAQNDKELALMKEYKKGLLQEMFV